MKNLEQFGIDPKDFAQRLQQMAASSTAGVKILFDSHIMVHFVVLFIKGNCGCL